LNDSHASFCAASFRALQKPGSVPQQLFETLNLWRANPFREGESNLCAGIELSIIEGERPLLTPRFFLTPGLLALNHLIGTASRLNHDPKVSKKGSTLLK
jgi:hypothetical protein